MNYLHRVFYTVLLLLSFTAVIIAQSDNPSSGRAPISNEGTTVPYVSTRTASVLAGDMAYAYSNQNSVTLTMPIPAGTPFTELAMFNTADFASSAVRGGDGNYYLITEGAPSYFCQIDPITGVVTPLGWIDGQGNEKATGIAYNSMNDTYYLTAGYYTTSNNLYSLDINTLTATLVAGFPNTNGTMIDIAINSSGVGYGYDVTDDNAYTFDPVTGATTLLGPIGFDANFGQGMDIDQATGTIYLSAFNYDTFTAQLRTMDPNTGATTLVVDWGLDQIAPFAINNEYELTVMSISQAIEDLNMDFIPDHLNETVTVEGIVFSPNYQTTNNSFYIADATAGTDIFMYSPPLFTWDMGDRLQITGVVSQYNGMTEIIPADSTGWVLVSTGNATPDPIVLTLAEYKADPEMYEGSLVGFVSLDLAGGTWPAEGSSANLQLTDGQDTVTFRIDSDTDIDGQPEPAWPVDVIGIGSQYDSSPPYDGGYQIFPRFYSTDFLPPYTIPAELTSFTADVNDNSVLLNWSTATETNNKGFEVQRNSGNGFMTLSFIPGHGTTTQPQSYSYTDQNISAGHYTYRLKQIDFQGTYSFSAEAGVDINAASSYDLEQNYPNPFNPSTIINFNLKIDSKVSLKVFDVLGQEVARLVNGAMTAGSHQVDFNASLLNSGVYFYRLEATGIDGSTFTSVKKMMLTK